MDTRPIFLENGISVCPLTDGPSNADLTGHTRCCQVPSETGYIGVEYYT